jgi:hypothetical protein
MIAQASALLWLRVLYLPRRSVGLLLSFIRRQSIVLAAPRRRNAALSLTLGVGALCGAVAIWAFRDQQEINLDTSTAVTLRNETVVYKQALPPEPIIQESAENSSIEQFEPSDEHDESLQSRYSSSVQVVRYVNLDALPEIGNVTSSAGDSTKKESASESTQKESAGDSTQKEPVKVGAAAFPAKDDEQNADDKESTLRCPQRASPSLMDQVDDYLWEVYQRVPIKKDGTGDFTWKDPVSAQHMGLCLRDYVIGGMDPEFREQLYHAGHAMDAAGLQWSMLSAFRDDYRQSLASGYKASSSNSLHGGSRRTGGYGHGRAIDITGPDGKESDVWKWLDAHGEKYGLHRPLPKKDPAHVQQIGDWHRIAVALRESRIGPEADNNKIAVALPEGEIRLAAVHKAKHSAATTKAKARKTAVASAK